MKEAVPHSKFYDDIRLSFPIGNVRCHALKCSYEQLHRSFPSHSHSSNSWEIHYIASGKGSITLNHLPYTIAANTLFVTGPHVEHSQIPDPSDPMTEYCVYLKFESKNHTLVHPNNPEFLHFFFQSHSFLGLDHEGIHPLMQKIFEELDRKELGYETALASLFTELLVLVVRNMNPSQSATKQPLRPSPADHDYLIIEECFLYEYRDLTLEHLASKLGLSPRQTERLLQKHYGKTFLQKKQEAKMSAALLLLSDPKNSITSISEQLGYSSIEHFSAAFRQSFAISPSNWRKNHR